MIQAEPSSSGSIRSGNKILRVGIQGYAGAFHDIAARLSFPQEQLEIVPAMTFDDLIAMIERDDQADVGLMAIENTLAGTLMYNYKLLYESSLSVTGEVYLRIRHNLLVLPGTRIEDLTEVHSHPMAIAQCRAFFRQYPHLRLVETADTALSARDVRDNAWRHIGAIASSRAAEMYGLDILAPGIETNKKNYTRFLVLGKKPGTGAAEKVSIVFSVDHAVGSLYKVLAVLAAYNINLTKIQSAPIIGKPWEYMFFVDFLAEGSVGFGQALDAIRPLTHELRMLGSYPQGLHHDNY